VEALKRGGCKKPSGKKSNHPGQGRKVQRLESEKVVTQSASHIFGEKGSIRGMGGRREQKIDKTNHQWGFDKGGTKAIPREG